MKVETEINKVLRTEAEMPETRGRLRRLILRPIVCSLCAALGIFGGLSALFIGLLCAVVHAVVADDHAFDRVGTVLLIVAIPMILIGSIFLDEINQKI